MIGGNDVRGTWLGLISGCLLVLACGLILAGCGDSGSDSPSAAQLEKAKEEGERVAQERARVDELEKEVRKLKRSARHPQASSSPSAVSAVATPPEDSESELLRTFHAPSGNVSCAITSTGAFCTVDSIATTFRVEGGGAGQIESGSALPRSFGELAGYGSTVSAGSVSCTVPEADEPRGITCIDGDSGHGFEASRISSRQDAY
jgi:hypothetical protein